MAVFPRASESVGEYDGVTKLQPGLLGRIGTQNQFVGSGKASSLCKRPGHAFNRLEGSEEIAVGRHHREPLVGIPQLSRHRERPGKRVDDLLVFLHADGVAWGIGVEDSVEH